MGVEQMVNYQLNKAPRLKKVVKRVYQRSMYAVSPKVRYEGKLARVSPNEKNREFFFGYYDKSPWDSSDRYLLCVSARDTWSEPSPRETADILLIDTKLPRAHAGRVKKIAQTSAWNVQQSCMLQWLGPDFSSRVLYNDCRNGQYVSVVLDIQSGKERVVPAAVYTVAGDGKTALTLDFSRLYNLRPGYGYYNVPEATKGVALPDATAVWKVDLERGEVSGLLTYKDFARFQPRPEMLRPGAVHKVNHLMLSPDGKRFAVLYRWFVGRRKYTRLLTCNVDGTGLYNLSDDDMVSHCCWKDEKTILAFANKKDGGPGYYLMEDRSQAYVRCWPQIAGDGHPSYSPNREWVVFDSYPDRARMQEIRIAKDTDVQGRSVKVLARVFSPFRYDNDTRCDLHPRWNHAGDRVCFDGVFEGRRGMYTVDIKAGKPRNNEKKVRVLFIMTACKKSGPVQQMLNIIRYMDRDYFEAVLLTIYPEPDDGSSQLCEWFPYVTHYYVPVGKTAILAGRTKKLSKKLAEIKPDVIHSLGVFPDYAISRMQVYPQVITLHNFIWEDYPAKYGRARGAILARMHLYAMKHAAKTVACSKSLSKLYKKKLKLTYGYIRNGVDTDLYTRPKAGEQKQIRRNIGLPQDAFIFVYCGQMIERKNQRFLLEAFRDHFPSDNMYLLLLGDGADYPALYGEFGKIQNIDFRGDVEHVNDYLKACDVYISTSKSEGMPNGVLEAMASGLPVILSDIVQHREIIQAACGIGFTYRQGDKADLIRKMEQIAADGCKRMGETAYKSAYENFSAYVMSKNYQDMYSAISLGLR